MVSLSKKLLKFPSRLLAAPAALALLLGAVPGSMAGSTDVIGGHNIIPINPKFNPPPQLFEEDANGNLVLDFNGDPIDLALDPGFLFFATIPPITPPVSAALGVALSQAISAGNRPSVLTPYSGILSGQGENAVFDSFGSLVANKASTLGQGKLGIGLSYEHSRFNSFNGEDIGSAVNGSFAQSATKTSPPVGGISSTSVFNSETDINAHDVILNADVITLSLTYGLLDNLDVGALVPYIFLHTSGHVDIRLKENIDVTLSDSSGPLGDIRGRSSRKFHGSFDRSFDGIGDMILFTKWQFMSQHGMPNRMTGPFDMALQAEVKLPTGDEGEFLGTGKTDEALRLLIQREITNAFRVRGEFGFNHSGIASQYNTFEYKAGAEYMVSSSLSASAELIGSYSHAFHTVLDIAAGAKYSVSRDFKVFAGVRAPLNSNGLRYSWSPILGVEYVFNKPNTAGMDNLQPLDSGAPDQPGAAPAASPSSAAPASPSSPAAPATQSAPAGTEAKPMNFEPGAPATAPAPASSGSLQLEPVQSQHLVGPKPDPAAPASQAPASAAPGTAALPLPSVRQP